MLDDADDLERDVFSSARSRPESLSHGVALRECHARQHFVTVVNGDHRPFGQGVQFAVGDDGGHLDDDVAVRIQAGHFQVDPDQVLWVLHAGAPRIGRHSSVVVKARPFTARR